MFTELRESLVPMIFDNSRSLGKYGEQSVSLFL